MGCPSVRGDNPRALASGLSYVQVDKHGITILYHLHQCIPCTSCKVGKGGIMQQNGCVDSPPVTSELRTFGRIDERLQQAQHTRIWYIG